jgi:hypothetical protein
MRPIAITVAAFVLAAGFARAAGTETMSVSAVGDLASLLEGEFTTEPSATNATAGQKPAGRTYYELAKRVDVPALGHDVVYSELREGGPEGRIIRQRLYALSLDDSGKIVMTSYSFANGAELAGSHANRAPLAKLAPADLKQEGCKLTWRKTEAGFEAIIPPLSCTSAPTSKSADEKTPTMGVSKTALAVPVDSDNGQTPTTFRRLR